MPKDVDILTDYQIVRALERNVGLIAHSAKALGITYEGLKRRIRNSPELKELVDEIRERRIDDSESALSKLIKRNDIQAIKFHLKCIGKERGYVETIKVEAGVTHGLSQEVMEGAKKSIADLVDTIKGGK